MHDAPQLRNRWHDLATYNAERARGIVHTAEWQERMAREQLAFDEAQTLQRRREGYEQLPNGSWLKIVVESKDFVAGTDAHGELHLVYKTWRRQLRETFRRAR